MFSKGYVRLQWITLVLIYLVIIAGSVVRTSGSGMGCPDWPKCFGQWVPPTEEASLPKDYKEVYGEQRVKKVEKFTKFLSSIGMSETAEKIKKDPATYEELPFNAGKTWTEYVNRLVGFLSGNAMLILLFWTFLRYRKDKRLVLLSFVNIFFLGLNAWFGSIVVATNLVPWVITVHMFLALFTVVLQLIIIRRVSPRFQKTLNLAGGVRYLIIIILLITAYQMFLGTQVREYIDDLTKQGIGREGWSTYFGWTFFIHRSFSWLVLILIGLLTYLNYKSDKVKAIYWAFVLLSLELIGGVLLAYADMPGMVQVSHLLFAAILFGVLTMLFLRMRRIAKPLVSTSLRG
jgi:cytochrome c oxidase assembly protein subunit 15